MGEDDANGALPFEPAEYEARREGLVDIIEMHGLDALVLTSPASLVHFSGLSGVPGGVVATRDAILTIVPDGQAGRPGHGEIAAHDGRKPDGFWEAVAAMLGTGKAVGVEAGHLTMVGADMLSHHLAPRQGMDVAPAIRSQRAVRGPAEIAFLRLLASAAQAGLGAIAGAAGDGLREIDLARAGEAAMVEALVREFPALPPGESRACVAVGRGGGAGQPCSTARRIATRDTLAISCRAILAGHAVSARRWVAPDDAVAAARRTARGAALAAIRPGATVEIVEAAVDAALDGLSGAARVAAPVLELDGGVVPEPVPKTGLEAGMVLSLSVHLRMGAGAAWQISEPVLVTETGADLLTG